ncbi:hypothetical protein ACVDG3_13965 [Meridianimarinicoccus sp. RP-17]|uniref:hypothetical protein n=1 Tax=Meridianimarinicoccus zhengii TaxID=2056810 RepID=UPI000DAB8A9B|nr:hypothetical protein [Phycocomes zhengii]
MPHLVRVYIRQVIIGYAISAAFVVLLLAFDVANLWSLISGSPVGWLACLMLWIFNGIVFAGVQFALALPRGHGADDGGSGRRDAVHGVLADPVAVRHTNR